MVLEKCDQRGDVWADGVRTRVSGATSDLHATDGENQDDCNKRFCSECNLKSAQSKEWGATKETEDTALKHVIKAMSEDAKDVWTSVEIQDLYKSESKDTFYIHWIVKVRSQNNIEHSF